MPIFQRMIARWSVLIHGMCLFGVRAATAARI